MSDTHPTPRPDPQPSGDPYTEPANSTVDDWHGQEVQSDIDDAERALRDAGGDLDRAEELFDADERDHPSEQFKVPDSERP